MRLVLRVLYAVLLLPVVVVGVVFGVLNTGAGQDFAAGQVGALTGGVVRLEGLRGRFPDRLTLRLLEVRDADGAWLVARDVALEWAPTALLHRQALVRGLTAARVEVPRLARPGVAGPGPAEPSRPFSLPVRVTVERLAAPEIVVGAAVLGAEAVVSAEGAADVRTLQDGVVRLALVSGTGRYGLDAALDGARVDARLAVDEPAQGLAARLASLPDLGAIHLAVSAVGPWSALAAKLELTAGSLAARATGVVDTEGGRATVDVTASAPAMTPAPGVSWEGVALDAHVAGPFTAPDATGTLRVEGVTAPGTSLRSLRAELSGNAGRATVNAVLEGLRIPGPDPALLERAPIRVRADARLDDPVRPVTFSVAHPVLAAEGTARTAGEPVVDVTLDLPDLGALGGLAGLELAGRSRLALHLVQGAATTLEVQGTLGLDKGPSPAPALLGAEAKLALAATLSGSEVTLRRLSLQGAKVTAEASGVSRSAGLDVTAKLGVTDLSVLAPTLTGGAVLDARVTGPPDRLAVDASLAGDVGAPGVPQGPLRAAAKLTGLPGAPAGRVTAEGTLAGAAVQVAVQAERAADGALRAVIERAEWRSFHAEGTVTLPAGASVPQGRVALRMGRLDELRPFIGQALSGGVVATAQLDPGVAVLEAELRDAGVPGSRVGRAVVKARVADPLGAPSVAATLDAQGISAAGFAGSARVEANGPQTALAVKLAADLAGGGTTARVAAGAVLDVPGQHLRVGSLEVTGAAGGMAPETVRLLAPATVQFGGRVAVDRLRLGVRTAVLEVAGQLAPRLEASATLRAPADVVAAFAPEYAADGNVTVDAKLSGTAAAPSGTVRVNAAGVRLRTGPGRAMPAADLVATAVLAGSGAKVDARLTAGSASLALSGTAGAAALNLRASGGLDLALLDPILGATGRRARGRVTLDGGVTGSPSNPAVSGTATLAEVEIQDFAQGFRLTGLRGTARAQGTSVRVDIAGRAGPGTLAVAGTAGVLEPGLPLDLALTLRNARPLASDLVTADLDADLTLRGKAAGGMQAAGRVLVRRAELQIPRTLPSSVVTLNVRRPGDRPPPPPATTAPPVALDLTVDAPRAVFVRGRGVDAEMGGTLRIRGSASAPQVGGGLEMRRGSISVAGTTLNFSRGKVGFDGTGVTGKIDPTLDFAADSSAGGVTATLAIGGYVSKPKITLSSVPDLPQDEVLAYLIFKRSAKELGPFQVAEIAAALAELTGVGGGGGLNPLESVRKGLGLDRLSVGAGTGSSSTPTIEAGRYVANGVYVGAKQGTTGGQTQATVQIDITKGLKLQTDVGAGQGGNSVGLTYQFEY